jgi:hypothetical protein
VQINTVPGVQAILPTATICDDGLIGVTYYDFRNHVPGMATLATDYWLVTSLDGMTWNESHGAGPFDFRIAPFAEGLFLGDYQALVSSGSTFLPFYARTNATGGNNATDIFSALRTVSVIIPRAAKDAAPLAMHAKAAAPLTMTPALEQILTDSARVTLKRRFAGRASPPGQQP